MAPALPLTQALILLNHHITYNLFCNNMNRGKPPFGKRSHSQFDNRMINGKSKRHNSTYDNSAMTPKPVDTVYRILCPGKKIGGVIGKGGSIVNALREETGAKIRVAETMPVVDERVIIIFSSPTKKSDISKDSENGEPTEKEHEHMEPHCSAQDALLRVHDRIVVEEDRFGGSTHEDDEHDGLVMARLLVPNNQVGCLLGKGGGIIQKLRSETGATIRILPMEHFPTGAMSSDELVQISGMPNVVKKALYEVSTLLHQNPRKENPVPAAAVPRGLYPPGASMPPLPPQGNPAWSNQNSGAHGTPPMPWFGGYNNKPHAFRAGGFNNIPAGNKGEIAEFSMKILCSAEKTGGVIGKGGGNVKQLEKETGAKIQVENAVPNAEERVVVVSSTEAPWDPRSPTIQAILQLQNKTSEITEKGIITTRILVPSSKVGCILGQGGHVITEMRRRTHADIRVYSKSDKPSCASADEELVQISGNMSVAKDALSEIASRLRERTLRGANAAVTPAPVGPFQGAAPAGSFSGRELLPPSMIGAGGSGGFDHFKGGARGNEAQGHPAQPPATGYPNVNSSVEIKIPNSAVSAVLGTGGSNISNICQISGAEVKLHDPQLAASECIVEIHGSSEQMKAAQSLLQAFVVSGEDTQGGMHHPTY